MFRFVYSDQQARCRPQAEICSPKKSAANATTLVVDLIVNAASHSQQESLEKSSGPSHQGPNVLLVQYRFIAGMLSGSVEAFHRSTVLASGPCAMVSVVVVFVVAEIGTAHVSSAITIR